MANQTSAAGSVQDQSSNPLQSLSKGDIRSMSIEGGALVITKHDGTVLVVENFGKLAASNGQLVLKDGALDASRLLISLATPAPHQDNHQAADGAVTIGQPAPGQVATYDLHSGTQYNIAFNLAEGAKITSKDGALIITFNDNGQIVLEHFADAVNSANPPQMVYTDGHYVSFADFLETLRLTSFVDHKDTHDNAPESTANIRNVNGDQVASAEKLAGIEPAAGDNGGGGAGSAGGYGFQSSADGADFGSAGTPTGPLGGTSLSFGAAGFGGDTGSTFIAPLAPANASIVTGNQVVAEDGTLNFTFDVNSHGTSTVQTTITITGLPTTGWTVAPNGGTFDSTTGTWTYTLPAGTTTFHGGPILTPPANSDADVDNVQITVTNHDNDTGLTSTSTSTIDIIVDAVGDNPDLFVTTTPVNEDIPAPLNITTRVTDTDGSEEIVAIYVHNVPAGFTLNHGVDQGGGKWLLTPAQLTGLTVTGPAGFSGDLPLRIESVSEETHPEGQDIDPSNNTGQSFYDITVHWNPVADTPTIEIGTPGAGGTVTGLSVLEDGTASVPVKVTLGDTDGSEFLTVKISGVPADWTFNNTGWTNLGGGAWQLVLAPGVNFNGNISLTPPANSDVDLSGFTVSAISTETSTGTTATASGTATIVVDAVADAPTITATGATGHEDTALAVTLVGGLTDTDGSEVISGYKVSGVPAGFTFNHGTDLGGGVWSFTPADIAGLKISAPADYFGSINLTATVLSTESPATDGETTTANNDAQASTGLSFTWQPVADTPTLSVNGVTGGAANATVLEDGTVSVPLVGTLDPHGTGNEVLTATITGVPGTWTFNSGTGTYNPGTGTWTLTLPAGTNLNTVVSFSPPANSDVDLNGLTVTLSSYEPATGTTATSTQTLNVIVDAVADAVTVNATDSTGNEDTALPVSITAALTDTDGSEVITGYKISGVPAGFSFNHGTNLGGGVWSFTPADIAGLKISAPADYFGKIDLTATVFSTENPPTDGETNTANNDAQFSDAFSITWTPVADTPTLSVNGVSGGDANASVLEDGTVSIPLVGTLDPHGTGNEVLTATITGIPSTWTFNSGTGTYNAATGTWTLTLPAGANLNTALSFSPPANSDVDLNGLTVTLSSYEPASGTTATATQTLNIVVDAVADPVTVDAHNASGNEDTALPVSITATLTDTDGSESVTGYAISGVPAGFTFNHGTNLGGGNWAFTPADMAGLKISAPADYFGTVNLTATVLSGEHPTDGETTTANNTATATDTFSVTWTPVADTPTLSVNGVTGGTANATVLEDGTVSVPLVGTLDPHGTGNEVLTATVTGIPSTWTFNSGTGTYNAATGTWTLTLAPGTNLNTALSFSPPANSDVDLNGLTVTLSSYEPASGTTATATQTLNVIVDAVADAPAVTAAPATGDEGHAIALNITAAVTDTDGSEVIDYVRISGMPTGSSLTAGSEVTPGVWQVTQAQLAGLKINVPDGTAGTYTLSVTAGSFEQNTHGGEPNTGNNHASTTINTLILTVNVDDVPTISTPEQITVDESNLGTTGLNVSDHVDVNFGVDTLGAFSANGNVELNGLKSHGNAIAVTLSGNTYTGTAGGTTVFTLKLNADGTYTYKQFAAVDHLNPANLNDSVPLKFGFTVTDNDGDATNSFITVNVLDDGPFAPDYLASVDEGSLTAGAISVTRTLPSLNFGFDGPGSVTPTGTFRAVVAVDGSTIALTSHGQPVNVTATANGYVGKVGTTTIFTLDVNPLTGEHTYKQYASIDHPDSGSADESLWLKFQMKASDAEGDSRTFFIGVDLKDDAPVAHAETFHIDTSAGATSAGNLIDAGSASSDGTVVSKVTLGATDYAVPATGTLTVNGTYGVLHISSNGAYSYTLNDAHGTIGDNFGFTLKDGDGDVSSSTFSFTASHDLTLTSVANTGGDTVQVKEDSTVAVPVAASYTGGDGDEVMTLKLTGVGAGWTVTGTGWVSSGGGVYTLTLPAGTHNYNSTVSFKPPVNSDADLTGVTLTTSLYDPDSGVTQTVNDSFNIVVDAVADQSTLTAPDNMTYFWIINQANPTALPISAQVTDTDGSEKITKVVIDLNGLFTNPCGTYTSLETSGVYLNKGTETAPGVWTINVNAQNAATALSGLSLMTPTTTGYYWALHNGAHAGNINVTSYVEETNLSGGEYNTADNQATITKVIHYSFTVSPLVLDLNGDGVHLTAQDQGVSFDMNNDGILDKTTWVDTHDGLLALDLNGNGAVDNQSELFGNNETADNGFANLAKYDVNADGIIDSADSVFANLKVWQDVNHDGVSQAGELHSLSDLGIAGIRTGAAETGVADADGYISHAGTFVYENGSEGQIVDAWFNTDDGATGHIGATVNGTDLKDTIYGTDRDDAIAGGAGNDTLYGGDGADVFAFASNGGIDTVKDFSTAQGDKLDLSQLLHDAGYDPVQDSINNFVYVNDNGGNTVVSFDATGSGNAAHATTVVVLENVTGVTVEDITAKTSMVA